MSILQSRKADNLKARFSDLRGRPQDMTYTELADIINRAFEAGVAAENDRAFAESNGFEIQPEPVRVMDVVPGSMLQLLNKDKS